MKAGKRLCDQCVLRSYTSRGAHFLWKLRWAELFYSINQLGDELFHTARGKNISQASKSEVLHRECARARAAAELQSHAPTVWVSVQCGWRENMGVAIRFVVVHSVKVAFTSAVISSLRAVKVIRLVIGAVKNEWAISLAAHTSDD